MTEYIHSGIAGKINRIVKPHIGNILITSEFGNAKESTLTEATLKAAVNDINRIKYAVTYKGEKATVDALPTTDNTKGDMWNVAENGHNYAWTGSEWDDLGGTAVGEESSEWEWTLVNTLTLSQASTTDWDAPPYSGIRIEGIPNTGTNNLMVTVIAPTTDTFTPNLSYSLFAYDNALAKYISVGAPLINQGNKTFEKELTYIIRKEHGIFLADGFKVSGGESKHGVYSLGGLSSNRIPNTIMNAYIYGNDFPVGTIIKTYIPSNLITN